MNTYLPRIDHCDTCDKDFEATEAGYAEHRHIPTRDGFCEQHNRVACPLHDEYMATSEELEAHNAAMDAMVRKTDEANQDYTRETLEEAREAWETFKEKFQEVGRMLEKSEDPSWQFEARRVGAYMPGFDPGYDWGMGYNADSWLDEIEAVIDGRDEEGPFGDRR